MSSTKRSPDAVVRHRIGLTIQYESQGSADLAALVERIRRWRTTTSVDNEVVEVKPGARHGIYRARLISRDAAAVVRKVKAALNLETAIRRVSMHIEYGSGLPAARTTVNLVA